MILVALLLVALLAAAPAAAIDAAVGVGWINLDTTIGAANKCLCSSDASTAGFTTTIVASGLSCTDCVELGTETSGNYVASIACSGAITGCAAAGEGSTMTLAVPTPVPTATAVPTATPIPTATPAWVILDAKGDLVCATAADTAARLAVGADGTILTADSGQATGLLWATKIPTPTPPNTPVPTHTHATVYYQTVADEATPVTQRATLDFAGAGVSCADSGGTKTVCTISGSAGVQPIHGVRVFDSNNFTHDNSGGYDTPNFDEESYDTDSYHIVAADCVGSGNPYPCCTGAGAGANCPMHINIPAGLGGYYHIGCAYSWDTNGTGYRMARICSRATVSAIDCSSSNFIAQGFEGNSTTNGTYTEAQAVAYLDAGMMIHCTSWQNSGGNRTIAGRSPATADNTMVFWAVLIAQ